MTLQKTCHGGWTAPPEAATQHPFLPWTQLFPGRRLRGRREKRDRKKIKRCFKESAGIFLMSNREEKDIKENRKQRTSTLFRCFHLSTAERQQVARCLRWHSNCFIVNEAWNLLSENTVSVCTVTLSLPYRLSPGLNAFEGTEGSNATVWLHFLQADGWKRGDFLLFIFKDDSRIFVKADRNTIIPKKEAECEKFATGLKHTLNLYYILREAGVYGLVPKSSCSGRQYLYLNSNPECPCKKTGVA